MKGGCKVGERWLQSRRKVAAKSEKGGRKPMVYGDYGFCLNVPNKQKWKSSGNEIQEKS